MRENTGQVLIFVDYYAKGLLDLSLHRKPCFIENLDFYNFDSIFDMTEKGQIKSLGPIIFGFQGHYMAVFGHIKHFMSGLYI